MEEKKGGGKKKKKEGKNHKKKALCSFMACGCLLALFSVLFLLLL